MVRHVNENEFNEITSEQDVVLVDFYASWCPPCKMLAPVLDEVASSRKYKIIKVNIDENPKLASKYNVEVVPTLMVFKNRAVVDKSVGYIDKEEVVELLDKHID